MRGGGPQFPTIATIQREVAAHFNVPLSMMTAGDASDGPRHKRHARPRQVAMALALLLTEKPRTVIGRHFGRDRSTIYHAARSIARRRRDDVELHRAMCRLSLELIRRG